MLLLDHTFIHSVVYTCREGIAEWHRIYVINWFQVKINSMYFILLFFNYKCKITVVQQPSSSSPPLGDHLSLLSVCESNAALFLHNCVSFKKTVFQNKNNLVSRIHYFANLNFG